MEIEDEALTQLWMNVCANVRRSNMHPDRLTEIYRGLTQDLLDMGWKGSSKVRVLSPEMVEVFEDLDILVPWQVQEHLDEARTRIDMVHENTASSNELLKGVLAAKRYLRLQMVQRRAQERLEAQGVVPVEDE